MQETGDAYLLNALLAFDTLARSEAFIAAMQAVIDRHDILRTAVVWEQLSEPVQVVWRQAKLPVEIRRFDPAQGPVAEQLVESCHPRHTRLNLSQAPLLRVVLAQEGDRWLLLLLFHHLVMDHTTLEVMLEEIVGAPAGIRRAVASGGAVPQLCGAGEGGLSPAEHEAFFRDMLGTVETPTLPFGLRRCARRWITDWRGELGTARGSGATAAAREPASGSDAGGTVSPGMGAGVVALLQSGRRGVRDGTVWPAAGRRGGRASAGDVHQHLAGAYPV